MSANLTFLSIAALLIAFASGASHAGTPLDLPGGADPVIAQGVSADWWSAVQRGIETSEYEARSVEGPISSGYQAPNRAQRLRTYFEPRGIRVVSRTATSAEAPTWEWSLSLAAWGRAGQAAASVETPTLHVDGNRVEYRRANLVEWYMNDSRGLEQGFTIARGPESKNASGADSPLRLEMAVGGNVTAELAADRQGVYILSADREEVIRFDHLYVTDAGNRVLESWFEADAERLAIVVNDRGAAYPITIDPLASSPAWTAEADDAGALFGSSVATAGDVNGDGYSDVIIGAPNFDGGQVDEGKAFVYYGSPGGLSLFPDWSIEGNQAGAQLGRSVCTAGDVNGDGFSDVIVGVQRFDSTRVDEGAARVHHGSASGLSTSPNWIAVGGQAGALFGRSVSTAGDVNNEIKTTRNLRDRSRGPAT